MNSEVFGGTLAGNQHFLIGFGSACAHMKTIYIRLELIEFGIVGSSLQALQEAFLGVFWSVWGNSRCHQAFTRYCPYVKKAIKYVWYYREFPSSTLQSTFEVSCEVFGETLGVAKHSIDIAGQKPRDMYPRQITFGITMSYLQALC
jgi:hypothetical protein